MWLLAKTWALVTLLAGSRAALPQRKLIERSRRTALTLVPLSLGVLMASAAWNRWTPIRPAQLLVSGTLLGALMLVALALAHRIQVGLDAADGEGHLSPFL